MFYGLKRNGPQIVIEMRAGVVCGEGFKTDTSF